MKKDTSKDFVQMLEKNGIKLPTEVQVMGISYPIIYTTDKEDPDISGLYGLCDYGQKFIKIERGMWDDCNGNVPRFQNTVYQVIRHEIVHAFFGESGLSDESEYAKNEELVDWIAIKIPQMAETMQNIGILYDRRGK